MEGKAKLGNHDLSGQYPKVPPLLRSPQSHSLVASSILFCSLFLSCFLSELFSHHLNIHRLIFPNVLDFSTVWEGKAGSYKGEIIPCAALTMCIASTFSQSLILISPMTLKPGKCQIPSLQYWVVTNACLTVKCLEGSWNPDWRFGL